MFRVRRRTVVTVAAVAGALLAGALVVTLTEGSPNTNGVTYLNGDIDLPMYAVGAACSRPGSPLPR
jgi:hypothetical protein